MSLCALVSLRGALEVVAVAKGLSMGDIAVLSTQHEPLRLDTEAGYRDGRWFAEQTTAIVGERPIHLRALHYALLARRSPTTRPQDNIDEDWRWLQGHAAKAAGWLGVHRLRSDCRRPEPRAEHAVGSRETGPSTNSIVGPPLGWALSGSAGIRRAYDRAVNARGKLRDTTYEDDPMADDATPPDVLSVSGEWLSTNEIDMDIAAIQDEGVRRRIAKAFDRLRGRAEYGLVFEKHKPESVVLHGQQVREDRYATLREDPGPRNAFRVVAIDNEKATLQPVNEHFRAVGEQTTKIVSELVPLARFGDPIFPGLEQTGDVRGAVDEDGNPTKPFHTVINGENFHALETLLYGYEGQVDCIYIDPPYNSGAQDWKYNNDYVNRDDVYRHSLWLSFMEKRLKLARRLLNPDDSILIVTIDEKEFLRLGLLLEQIFKGCPIAMVTSVISAKGAARQRSFSRVEEHIFYVLIGEAAIVHGASNMLPHYSASDEEEDADDGDEEEALPRPIEWLGLRRREPTSKRGARPNQFYGIFVDEETGRLQSVGEALDDDVDRHTVKPPKGAVAIWPLDSKGRETLWGLTPDVLRANWANGYVRVSNWKPAEKRGTVQYLTTGTIEKINDGRITVTGHADDGHVEGHVNGDVEAAVRPKRVWHQKSHNAETGGTNVLEKIIPGRRFDYCKSLYAVEDTVRFAVGSKRDALILDFFAGSGTTTHAVMRLNRQDNGRRRSILVTNNEVSVREQEALIAEGLHPGDDEWEELGICERITKPRIRAAISGRTPEGVEIKGKYEIRGADVPDPFPIKDGFEENARFFNLTYLDPEVVEAKQTFEQIAHLLWLIGGAEGPVIEKEPRSGWALPDGATYGVLFRNKGRAAFAEALRSRTEAGDPPRRVFIVADSTDEYHRSLEELGADPVHTTRLYRSYLKNFRTNVVDLKEEL
ncbi:MAG: DNA methyltransferase [Longimicrobiales bacterium]